jgi:hypothetical protein
VKPGTAALVLQQARRTCRSHAEALGDALADIALRAFVPADLESLAKADRRLLDQFAYRYTRLQDDMGARLMPAVLTALGEDIVALPALDRFNRLEQLGWLPSADEWMELRQVRNPFTHDYPESAEERFERFQTALAAAERLRQLIGRFGGLLERRFPE